MTEGDRSVKVRCPKCGGEDIWFNEPQVGHRMGVVVGIDAAGLLMLDTWDHLPGDIGSLTLECHGCDHAWKTKRREGPHHGPPAEEARSRG